MTISSSPKLTKGGIVLIDPETAQVQRVIALQYNAESLKRELKSQESGGEAGADRAEPTRFKGPAVETISFEADLDATDQLEFPDQNAAAVAYGIAPQIALLESLSQPGSAQLGKVNSQASSGTLEIAPMLAPLLLLVWGAGRVIPVKLTSFSVTEEAQRLFIFRNEPNSEPSPQRGQRPFHPRRREVQKSTRGGSLFMAYLQNREQLAAKAQPASLSTLGVAGV